MRARSLEFNKSLANHGLAGVPLEGSESHHLKSTMGECRSMHINAYGEMLRSNLQCEPPAKTGGPKGLRLTVSSHGTQLPGEEVIRRPWSANRYLTILQLLGGCVVAVLIFLNRFGIDEMGDVDEHALRRNLLATYFFFQRIE
jgi:hypothetical protein